MKTSKITFGTLAGLAIGSLVGILFAPEKGSKTRKQIMAKGDAYLAEMKSKSDEFFDSLSENVENEKRELVSKGKSKSYHQKKAVK